MSRILLAIFVYSSIPLHVAAVFFTPVEPDNLSTIYRFLEKWAGNSYVKLVTVVLDDYQQDYDFNIQHCVFDALNVSIKMVTIKHLIYLRFGNMNRDYESFDQGSCVVLLFTDFEHLRQIFNSPHLISFWQPDKFYLLYDYTHKSVDWYEVKRFFQWGFEKLWRFRRIFRVMVFIGEKIIRYDLIDYAGYHTRFFFNSSCDWYCVKNNEDSILMVNEPDKTFVTDFFEERANYHMYPLKVSIFRTSTMPVIGGKFSGMDFKYLEEVTKMLNVTTVLMKSPEKFGWQENGIFFGTIGHLVYQLADVSFNQFFIKDYLTRQVEFTTAVGNDKLCIMVPKAPPIPDYLIFVKTFNGEAWMLIFLGYFAILAITMILRDERNREILDNLSDCEAKCFYAFLAFLHASFSRNSCFLAEQNEAAINGDTKKGEYNGVARNPFRTDRYEPWKISRNFLSHVLSAGKYLVHMYLQMIQPFESKRTLFPQRLILMCCMLMSIILNGVFTSQLASFLSKRIYYEDIDTLEQLDRSGLPILTNSRDIMDDALTDSTSPVLQHLRRRLQYANDSESNRRLFETKDAAIIHRLGTISLKYDEFERKKNVHILKEHPKYYVIGFAMTKGSPFRKRINSILGRLNNGGFYMKWYQGMFQSQKHLFREQKPSEHRKITIRHLLIPFAILQLGLVTSTIVFIREYRQNNPR
ncbi:uncharacterized protein LOC143265303 [Megachile rotundata]|uniref:uncharacterized protein LOC143265303 n=1 Tax=Megachile rotundata TaxID=143995 RepID=UPI003FD05A84